jgi:stage II sporulation protein D
VELFESERPTTIGPLRISPAGTGLDVDGRHRGQSLRIRGPGPHWTETHVVRGALEVQRTDRGLRVINRVALEDYVASTVGGELPHRWEEEVLKAQAVVTRTYALYQQSRSQARAYDVSADTRHQVYAGVAGETPRIVEATRSTLGEVLLHEGELILAAFHSASGGRTASAGEVWGESIPYLQSQNVEGEEDSPYTYWRAVISGPKLARALVPLGLSAGALREVRVVERSASGRARRVWVDGARGEGSLSARDLRRVVGTSVIRSTLFDVREEGGDFIFAGSGHGHGVGMSQWGARAMARAGASYREILAAFYPGTELRRLDVQTSASSERSLQ